MKKTVEGIVKEIKELVDQLAAMTVTKSSVSKSSVKVTAKAKKGASGAISILIEEGFFDSPKDLPAVMGKLQEIGRWYPQPNVSMNLLNLTKKRTFSRIKGTKTKNWQYVLRK